jgi:hypothetical protein
MTETIAFLVILTGLIGGAIVAALTTRRGGWMLAAVIGAGFLALGGHLVCVWRPHWIAPAIAGTDLSLLYPSIGWVPAVGLLTALGPRAEPRNRRVVLLFVGFLAVYGLWDAASLLEDPGAVLEAPSRWNGDCCLQSTGWSCAPAAACSLLRRLGIDADEAEMARLMRSRRWFGTDLLKMHRGLARKLEGAPHEVELVRLGYDELVAARAPALASIKHQLLIDHAVAVVEARPDGVTLLDPLVGPRQLSREGFERIWRRDAILVRPAPR